MCHSKMNIFFELNFHGLRFMSSTIAVIYYPPLEKMKVIVLFPKYRRIIVSNSSGNSKIICKQFASRRNSTVLVSSFPIFAFTRYLQSFQQFVFKFGRLVYKKKLYKYQNNAQRNTNARKTQVFCALLLPKICLAI